MRKENKLVLLKLGGLLAVTWLAKSLLSLLGTKPDLPSIFWSALCTIIFLAVVTGNPGEPTEAEIAIQEISEHLVHNFDMAHGDAINRATQLVSRMGSNGARYHVFTKESK